MTDTITDQPAAEVGRRILFTGYGGTDTPHPGIITALAEDGALMVRLDGYRDSIHIDPTRLPATKSLELLDEVVEVPDLPMGRFKPVVGDTPGLQKFEGVPYTQIGEDGETLLILTEAKDQAVAVARAHFEQIGLDPDYVAEYRMTAHWWVCEWQPEHAEYPWLATWAKQSDDLAFHAYSLNT